MTRDKWLLPWNEVMIAFEFPQLGRSSFDGKLRVVLSENYAFRWQYWCDLSFFDWTLQDLRNNPRGRFFALNRASAMKKCDEILTKLGYELLSGARAEKLKLLL